MQLYPRIIIVTELDSDIFKSNVSALFENVQSNAVNYCTQLALLITGFVPILSSCIEFLRNNKDKQFLTAVHLL